MEVVKLAEVANPRAHPRLECWPTARRLEQVTPDMNPAKGQKQLVILQGQAFLGTVTVTYQHAVAEGLSYLSTMVLGNISPTPWSPPVRHHGGRLRHPQIPTMARFACDLFKHGPARFIPMEELCRPLPRVEHRH